MLRVGLTGGIATGKSYVAERLASRGIPVIDADVIAREVVAPGTPGHAAVLARFGPAVVASNGQLDRKALGDIVRSTPPSISVLRRVALPSSSTLMEPRESVIVPSSMTVTSGLATGWPTRPE